MNLISKKRNYLLILVCFLVYMSTYFLKYSYNANIVNIEQKFSVSHSETGLVSTLFFITYGAGQFINGALVRKYKLRFFIPVVILISCLLNILVMTTPNGSFYLIKYYWLVNGLVLSCLWPCTIRMLSDNIADKYRNKAIVIFGLVTATGTASAYGLSSLLTGLNQFNLIFLIGAIIGATFAIFWFLLFNKVSIPLEEQDIKKKEVIHKDKENKSFYVYVTITGLLCAVCSFARDGITNWFPTILCEKFNFDRSYSVLITIILPIGQFFGSLSAVQFKKVIKSHMLLSALSITIALAFLSIGFFFDFNEKISLIISIIVVIFFTTCSLAVGIHIIPMVWSKYRNSGLYAGIFNGCCYVGAAAAAYGLGAIADNGSWSKVFTVIVIVLGVATLIAGTYLIIAKKFHLGVNESNGKPAEKQFKSHN